MLNQAPGRFGAVVRLDCERQWRERSTVPVRRRRYRHRQVVLPGREAVRFLGWKFQGIWYRFHEMKGALLCCFSDIFALIWWRLCLGFFFSGLNWLHLSDFLSVCFSAKKCLFSGQIFPFTVFIAVKTASQAFDLFIRGGDSSVAECPPNW